MPSITREQAQKLNAQAPGNWRFDVRYYVIHGEKTLVRQIELDGGRYLEARLYYVENYERRSNEHCSWNAPAGHYYTGLHYQIYSPSSTPGCYHSFGLGTLLNLDNGQHAKRNYKDLCALAKSVTDDWILTKANVKTIHDDLALLQLPS